MTSGLVSGDLVLINAKISSGVCEYQSFGLYYIFFYNRKGTLQFAAYLTIVPYNIIYAPS